MEKTPDHAGVVAENPFVRFYNGERGYVECTVTPKQWHSDYQVVPYVTRPGAPLVRRARFTIQNGRPGATRTG
jgi:alkaline phosphatase D